MTSTTDDPVDLATEFLEGVRALQAVRVLDAWSVVQSGRCYVITWITDDSHSCELLETGEVQHDGERFFAKTPDAARIAAATALVAADPSLDPGAK